MILILAPHVRLSDWAQGQASSVYCVSAGLLEEGSVSGGLQSFWLQGPVSWKTVFPWTRARGWFGDVLSALHALCTLFLLFLYQFPLRSSGPRSWKLGTPEMESATIIT